MKIEERLDKMKRVYLDTSVSDETVISEWQVLENVLGKQQKTYVSPLIFRAIAFAIIILLCTGGVVSLAQASKPGELLYPVKDFSQKAVKKIQKTAPVFFTSEPILTEKPVETPTVTPKKDENDDKNVQGVSDENKKKNEDTNNNRRSTHEKNTWEQRGQGVKSNSDSKKKSNDDKNENSGENNNQQQSNGNDEH